MLQRPIETTGIIGMWEFAPPFIPDFMGLDEPLVDGASVNTRQVPGLEFPHATANIGLQEMSSKSYTLANPLMTKRSAFWRQYFYFLMSLLAAAVIVYGFSHTIDQNLIHPKIPRPRLLYFHAALFTGWLVFFILQSLLVRTHNVRIHRMIGWFGVGMGALIPLVGVATAVTMARFNMMQLKMNNADVDMIIPMWDMVAFTPAFILAIYWRKKPEFHRRLILIATCALTAAGWGRFPEWLLPPVIFYAGVDLLILLGVFRDWMVNRKVHPVYSYALPAFIAGQTAVMYANVHRSAVWMRIAHALLG